MTAGNIAEHLPPGFDIVAFTRGDTDSFMSNLIYLPLPVDRQEFLNTVGVLVNSVSSFTKRSVSDEDVISKAKLILKETNGFSELQAHKYLQRESMKMGKKIAVLAQEIINDFM
jgi:response regulator NasT